MRNTPVLILMALLLAAASCKKKDNADPAPTPTPTPTPAYYFKFKLDGASYNLQADSPQYMYLYLNNAGGYLMPSFTESASLRLEWPANDSVKESDLMALKGKTLYFNDTTVHPVIAFDTAVTSSGATDWTSIDTSDTQYNVKITDVTYLRDAYALAYPVKTYVVTGTCTAVLLLDNRRRILSDGQFHFIISRRY